MRKLSSFILGNQLFEHDLGMFVMAFKWPAILAVCITAAITWWRVATGLTDHEAYLVWMRIYAAGYLFLDLPQAKFVSIADPLGAPHLVPIAILDSYPPVAIAWMQFKALIWSSALWCALALVILTFAYVILSTRYGGAAAAVRHVRGALMVSADELDARIKRLNLTPHTARLKALFGWGYYFLKTQDRLGGLGIHAFRIAGIDYPLGSENRHTAIIGTTGSGKTQTLLDMVELVRAGNGKCVIFDLKGDFVTAFYDPARDVILNPSDARCPAWSIFDECHTLSEFTVAAEALIPGDASLSDSFWVEGARTMFTNYCMEMIALGQPSNAALADRLMTAPLEEIFAVLKDTPAGVLVDKDTPRMGQSIRAVFNTNARGLQLLPTSGPSFSVRNWVADPSRRGSIIFLSTRLIDMPLCRQLLTLWIDTALITLMSGKRASKPEMWFFVDEMAALHKLPTLKQALETSRSYGGAIVLGCHSNAQIRDVYGKDADQTILGLTRTKLFFAAADEESAKYAADIIGNEEVIDVQHGATIGLNSMRDARSLSRSRTNRLLKLPQEVMELPSLSGFLKFSEGLPAAPITIVPKDRPELAQSFVARTGESGKFRPVQDAVTRTRRTSETGQGGNDSGAKTALGTEKISASPDEEAPDDGESGRQNQTQQQASHNHAPLRLGASVRRRSTGRMQGNNAESGMGGQKDNERASSDAWGHPPLPSQSTRSPHEHPRSSELTQGTGDKQPVANRMAGQSKPVVPAVVNTVSPAHRAASHKSGPSSQTKGKSKQDRAGPQSRHRAAEGEFKGPDELDFDM